MMSGKTSIGIGSYDNANIDILQAALNFLRVKNLVSAAIQRNAKPLRCSFWGTPGPAKPI